MKNLKRIIFVFILCLMGLNMFSIKTYANTVKILGYETSTGSWEESTDDYSGETDLKVTVSECDIFDDGYFYENQEDEESWQINGEGFGICGKIKYSRNLTEEEKSSFWHGGWICNENGDIDEEGSFWSHYDGNFMVEFDDNMPSGKYTYTFDQYLGGFKGIQVVVNIYFEYTADDESSTEQPPQQEPSNEEDIVYSGKSGDLNWSIDTAGYLRITGHGDYELDGTIYTYYVDENDEEHPMEHKVPKWCEYGPYSDTIKSVIVEVDGITSCYHMFYWLHEVESIDVSGLDTSKVTDMSGMFEECMNLKILDVSEFETEKVTDMSDMFAGCWELETLDVSGFQTEEVTDMSNMFGNCYELKELDVSGFQTQNVTDMNWMFAYCGSLTELDVSGFQTQNVLNMRYMFYGCCNLTTLDVSKFNTKNLENMTWMFGYCESLTELDISGFDTKNVTGFGGMFMGCSSLKALDVSKFNTDKATHMWWMFAGCSGLEKLDISNFSTENVVEMFDMFEGCNNLTQITAPANVKMETSLPVVEGYIWKGENGIIYTSMQTGLSDKMIYIREKQGAQGSSGNQTNPSIPEQKTEDKEQTDDDMSSQLPDTGNQGQIEGETDSQSTLPAVGTKHTISNGIYKVTKSSAANKEVTFTKPKNSKKTSLTIPATIKIDGQTYKVTEIAAKAFKNNKKLKSITIGKNVKKIGKEVFSGCTKLKKITIKSTVLTNVGKNAIKGIDKKATIKCPKKQLTKYKKLFKSKTGYKKNMKIKK